MPVSALKVQGDGRWGEISSVVGAPFAWAAVDDSDSGTHDGDASYVVVQAAGRATFKIFAGQGGIVPSSLSVTVAAREDAGGGAVNLSVILAKGGVYAGEFIAYAYGPGSYTIHTAVFGTNPLTGTTWKAGDLDGLEAGVLNTGVGQARLTLVSASLTWQAQTYGAGLGAGLR